jgi:phosphatidylglycerol:prolipoprotein diacylglycerol transferase
MILATLAIRSVVDPGYVWVASMLVAVLWSVIAANRVGLDPAPMYWAALAASAAGIWGSHLLGILVYHTEGQFIWLRVWEGGKSWYGGLLGGTLAALIAFRITGRPVLRYADAMVPATVLGYAIGRIGCFLHGDDYGTLSSVPWAVQYGLGTEAHWGQARAHIIDAADSLTLPVHPTQLYHSLLGLSLFGVLSLVRPEQPGRRLALFALGYGIGRFALEFFRGDFSAAFGPLSLHQAISLFLIAGGTALLLLARGGAPTAVAEAP